MAGTAFLKGAGNNRRADEADRTADILAGYQDEINYQRALSDASVQAYNMTNEFGQLISQQQAVASGMGKSSTGGSAQAMNREGQRTLNRDIQRLYEGAEFVRMTGDVNAAARSASSAAKSSSRSNNLMKSGLLLGSKMFDFGGSTKKKGS